MTIINPNSISGISSITALNSTAAINLFKADGTAANIIAGVTTGTNFKTGSSNLHNVGIEIAGINVLGADTPIGAGATIYNSGAAVFTGIVTANAITIPADNAKIQIGASQDLELYHNGSNSFIVNKTGYLQINATETEVGLYVNPNAAVRLAYDGDMKFETTSSGARVFNGASGGGILEVYSGDAGSTAGPELKLIRNSGSPADADYIGQIKFVGESDTSVERNYAKITGKILDASNGTEDGIIEFAHIKAGSQVITGRWRSDSLQLLNGTALTVAGNADFSAGIDVTGVIETTVAGADNMMKIKTTSSGDPILQFNASGSGGHDIFYNRSTNELTFKAAGGSDRLKIAANGDLLPAIDSQYNIGSNTVRFANIYADTLYGDGSNLTGITQTTINSNADNRIITGSGTANTLNAEGNFLHDPTTCDTTIQHYEALKVVDLIIKNTNNHGNAAGARITIESGSAANTGPQFQMICGSHNWSMQVPKAAGNLEFNNNGSPAFNMLNTNDFLLYDGDVVIGTAGHGIDFSARGNAGGMTSELLDHYEEGSWTPSIYPMSSNIPVTYTTRVGQYTRIGNTVYWQFKLQVSNITGNRNQGFGINGFPYNINNTHTQCSSEFYGETWDGEIPTTIKYISNTNRGVCYYYADAMKYYSSSMLDINVSSSMLMGAGHYFV